MELIDLYRRMALARAFELALADLWRRGLISGELHLGTGDEAVAAGVTAHLKAGDAAALDHRATPFLALMEIDLRAIVAEVLGREGGLCRGRGGHMHLFSKDHLVATSGIVGAAGPAAVGFGLAARRLRPGSVAVATFGDGAANQGMLMESLNLAVVWRVPVLFVCKDNGWAITTREGAMTGGGLEERARAFGLETRAVDGLDAEAVWGAAGELVSRARRGKGPGFLLARTARLDGHMLGDPLVRAAAAPTTDGREIFSKVVSATFKRGGGLRARVKSLGTMTNTMRHARKGHQGGGSDPLVRARKALKKRAAEVEQADVESRERVAAAVAAALEEAP
ncbi:MAG: thiamine pyrophosphate-dependent dehydrogenase E1 component subunit alpha [Deltaproteobacteria bacterium]|nr:MAG: thiamine pyrophosphate-dependent dehydrogenase E1 component subunit alpha [Deltaproteobacteria bacterium]